MTKPPKKTAAKRKPKKLQTKTGLDFEVWKDDGGYEYVQWAQQAVVLDWTGNLYLSEAKKLRAMLDYVIEKAEPRKASKSKAGKG